MEWTAGWKQSTRRRLQRFRPRLTMWKTVDERRRTYSIFFLHNKKQKKNAAAAVNMPHLLNNMK